MGGGFRAGRVVAGPFLVAAQGELAPHLLFRLQVTLCQTSGWLLVLLAQTAFPFPDRRPSPVPTARRCRLVLQEGP